jgi:hypothetical protein
MRRPVLSRQGSRFFLVCMATTAAIVFAFQACGEFAAEKQPLLVSSVSEESLCQADSRLLSIKAEAIVTVNCQKCHDKNAVTVGQNSFHAVFDLDKMIAEGDLVPGDSGSSLLFAKVAGGAHGGPAATGDLSAQPKSASGLSANEIQSLADWINKGLVPCPTNAANTTGAPTFKANILPLLTSHNCLGCHSVPSTANSNVGLSLYSDALKNIVASSPTTSSLLLALPKMSGASYANSPFSAADLTLIQNWINSGAQP